MTETIAVGQEEPLRSRTVYDIADRLIRRIDQQQFVTETTHETGGRRTTQILPGDATRVTERYLDGQTKSETDTASVAQQHTYGINLDGATFHLSVSRLLPSFIHSLHSDVVSPVTIH